MSETLYISSFAARNHDSFQLGQDLQTIDPNIALEDWCKAQFQGIENLTYRKFYKMDLVSKLAFLLGEFCVNEQFMASPENKRGIILANASASLATDEKFYHHSDQSDYFPSPADFVYTLPNIMSGELCIRHKIKGENAFFIFEKFPIPFMEWYLTDLFQQMKIEVALLGWIEVYRNHVSAFMAQISKRKGSLNINFNTENLNALIGSKYGNGSTH